MQENAMQDTDNQNLDNIRNYNENEKHKDDERVNEKQNDKQDEHENPNEENEKQNENENENDGDEEKSSKQLTLKSLNVNNCLKPYLITMNPKIVSTESFGSRWKLEDVPLKYYYERHQASIKNGKEEVALRALAHQYVNTLAKIDQIHISLPPDLPPLKSTNSNSIKTSINIDNSNLKNGSAVHENPDVIVVQDSKQDLKRNSESKIENVSELKNEKVLESKNEKVLEPKIIEPKHDEKLQDKQVKDKQKDDGLKFKQKEKEKEKQEIKKIQEPIENPFLNFNLKSDLKTTENVKRKEKEKDIEKKLSSNRSEIFDSLIRKYSNKNKLNFDQSKTIFEKEDLVIQQLNKHLHDKRGTCESTGIPYLLEVDQNSSFSTIYENLINDQRIDYQNLQKWKLRQRLDLLNDIHFKQRKMVLSTFLNYKKPHHFFVKYNVFKQFAALLEEHQLDIPFDWQTSKFFKIGEFCKMYQDEIARKLKHELNEIKKLEDEKQKELELKKSQDIKRNLEMEIEKQKILDQDQEKQKILEEKQKQQKKMEQKKNVEKEKKIKSEKESFVFEAKKISSKIKEPEISQGLISSSLSNQNSMIQNPFLDQSINNTTDIPSNLNFSDPPFSTGNQEQSLFAFQNQNQNQNQNNPQFTSDYSDYHQNLQNDPQFGSQNLNQQFENQNGQFIENQNLENQNLEDKFEIKMESALSNKIKKVPKIKLDKPKRKPKPNFNNFDDLDNDSNNVDIKQKQQEIDKKLEKEFEQEQKKFEKKENARKSRNKTRALSNFSKIDLANSVLQKKTPSIDSFSSLDSSFDSSFDQNVANPNTRKKQSKINVNQVANADAFFDQSQKNDSNDTNSSIKDNEDEENYQENESVDLKNENEDGRNDQEPGEIAINEVETPIPFNSAQFNSKYNPAILASSSQYHHQHQNQQQHEDENENLTHEQKSIDTRALNSKEQKINSGYDNSNVDHLLSSQNTQQNLQQNVQNSRQGQRQNQMLVAQNETPRNDSRQIIENPKTVDGNEVGGLDLWNNYRAGDHRRLKDYQTTSGPLGLFPPRPISNPLQNLNPNVSQNSNFNPNLLPVSNNQQFQQYQQYNSAPIVQPQFHNINQSAQLFSNIQSQQYDSNGEKNGEKSSDQILLNLLEMLSGDPEIKPRLPYFLAKYGFSHLEKKLDLSSNIKPDQKHIVVNEKQAPTVNENQSVVSEKEKEKTIVENDSKKEKKEKEKVEKRNGVLSKTCEMYEQLKMDGQQLKDDPEKFRQKAHDDFLKKELKDKYIPSMAEVNQRQEDDFLRKMNETQLFEQRQDANREAVIAQKTTEYKFMGKLMGCAGKLFKKQFRSVGLNFENLGETFEKKLCSNQVQDQLRNIHTLEGGSQIADPYHGLRLLFLESILDSAKEAPQHEAERVMLQEMMDRTNPDLKRFFDRKNRKPHHRSHRKHKSKHVSRDSNNSNRDSNNSRDSNRDRERDDERKNRRRESDSESEDNKKNNQRQADLGQGRGRDQERDRERQESNNSRQFSGNRDSKHRNDRDSRNDRNERDSRNKEKEKVDLQPESPGSSEMSSSEKRKRDKLKLRKEQQAQLAKEDQPEKNDKNDEKKDQDPEKKSRSINDNTLIDSNHNQITTQQNNNQIQIQEHKVQEQNDKSVENINIKIEQKTDEKLNNSKTMEKREDTDIGESDLELTDSNFEPIDRREIPNIKKSKDYQDCVGGLQGLIRSASLLVTPQQDKEGKIKAQVDILQLKQKELTESLRSKFHKADQILNDQTIVEQNSSTQNSSIKIEVEPDSSLNSSSTSSFNSNSSSSSNSISIVDSNLNK